jgi:hypothetical protein
VNVTASGDKELVEAVSFLNAAKTSDVDVRPFMRFMRRFRIEALLRAHPAAVQRGRDDATMVDDTKFATARNEKPETSGKAETSAIDYRMIWHGDNTKRLPWRGGMFDLILGRRVARFCGGASAAACAVPSHLPRFLQEVTRVRK